MFATTLIAAQCYISKAMEAKRDQVEQMVEIDSACAGSPDGRTEGEKADFGNGSESVEGCCEWAWPAIARCELGRRKLN